MARKKSTENSFADLVARLNAMSNMTPEEERASLMEAAKQEPKILDDKDISLADIARLAGIKEYTEAPKVSEKAEKLVESITKEEEPKTESDITKAIKESDADDSISANIKRAVTEESKRLDKIAELEAQLAEKYEMSEHTLYKMAKQGDWKAKQQEQIVKYQQEISKKKREKLSLEGVAIDDRIINVSKQLLDKVVTNIHNKETLSPYQIDSLASASLKIQKMAKLALGESTENINIDTNTDTDETFREAIRLLDTVRAERIETESVSNYN